MGAGADGIADQIQAPNVQTVFERICLVRSLQVFPQKWGGACWTTANRLRLTSSVGVRRLRDKDQLGTWRSERRVLTSIRLGFSLPIRGVTVRSGSVPQGTVTTDRTDGVSIKVHLGSESAARPWGRFLHVWAQRAVIT